MVTPKIITFIYYLLLLAVLVAGISMLFTASNILAGLLTGILTIVLGSLGVRIYCEIFIVFFKMNEALQELKKK